MANGNQSLSRGLSILTELELAEHALGVREIARRLELSPTIVQRLINTLVETGFLIQEPSNQKYALGYKALSLGSSMLDENSLVAASMTILTALSKELNVNCFLSVITGNQLVYVLSLQSPGPISINSGAGTKAAFHSTAMGKTMLASQADGRARSLLEFEVLKKFTDHTITDVEAIMSELPTIRSQGYAASINENLVGVNSVGAVVRGASGKAFAAVSAAYAPSLQPHVQLPELIQRITNAAREISRQLGCPEAALEKFNPLYEVGSNVA